MSSPDPLAGIDDIDWSRLFHAYGRATDVPDQLRALRSNDADIRGRAHYQLRGNVYHQGTRWQGSYAVIPFLIALADDPSTPERALVIDLIRLVAVGDHSAESTYEFAEALSSEDDPPEWEDLVERFPDVAELAHIAWAREAYRAAQAEAGRIGRWIDSADPAVVEAATRLLAWFPAA